MYTLEQSVKASFILLSFVHEEKYKAICTICHSWYDDDYCYVAFLIWKHVELLASPLVLKAHFQPWCNALRDSISCNTKFPYYWKPSKIVFLKSHPGRIVNCFTVNTFAVRHFTVSLQYFEFCPEESEENYFLSVTLGSLRTLWTESAKRTTFKFFHFLEALEDSKWR